MIMVKNYGNARATTGTYGSARISASTFYLRKFNAVRYWVDAQLVCDKCACAKKRWLGTG